MGEQCATARGLPLQGFESVGLDGKDPKIDLTGEVAGGGFADLCGCGKMYEAVCDIDRCAARFAVVA